MTADCGMGSLLTQDLELSLLGTSVAGAIADMISCHNCLFLVCDDDEDEGEKCPL